jgi:hypothetical protein
VQGFEETEEQRLDAEREAKLEPDILAVEKLKALVRERGEEEGSQWSRLNALQLQLRLKDTCPCPRGVFS